MDMETIELDHQIDITNRQIAYEKDLQKKEILNKKLQKLRLQKEIAVIKARIDAISR